MVLADVSDLPDSTSFGLLLERIIGFLQFLEDVLNTNKDDLSKLIFKLLAELPQLRETSLEAMKHNERRPLSNSVI